MTETSVSNISVQQLLNSVGTALQSLGPKLHKIEELVLTTPEFELSSDKLRDLQDIDLIIQQINDLERTVLCIAETDVGGAFVSIEELRDRLRLNEMRAQLLKRDNAGSGLETDAVRAVVLF